MEALTARLQPEQVEVEVPDQHPAPPLPDDEAPAILEELVIEAISIDGMCGVY